MATKTVSGVRYYGRRYYSPSQGRFLGRDPKDEKGGLHLYAFVRNNPVNRWDYLGMVDQMAAYVVNGGRREIKQEEDENGCLWEVTYQDMSNDPAYGIEDMQVVDRKKISCPKSSDSGDDNDGVFAQDKSAPRPPKNSKEAKAQGTEKFKSAPQSLKDALCGGFLNASKANAVYGPQKTSNGFTFYREFGITAAVYSDGTVITKDRTGPLIAWNGDVGVTENFDPFTGPPGALQIPGQPNTTRYYINNGSPAHVNDGSQLAQFYSFHTHPNDSGGSAGLSGVDGGSYGNIPGIVAGAPAGGYPVFGGAFDGQTNTFFGKIGDADYSISFKDLRSILGCK